MKRALLVVLCAGLVAMAAAQTEDKKAGQEAVLKAADLNTKVFPESVFYRGQTAPVQMRNTGGVKFADGMFVLVGLVDNSGYSTQIREKYQAYLITEVPLSVGGQELKPGSYGCGFVEGKFLVMDVANNDVLQTDGQKDAELKRPVPLQVTKGEGGYRLYFGREYVELARK